MANTSFEGIGMLIWEISKCENGNIDAIVAKCISNSIQWVAFKAVDGVRWFGGGLTPGVVQKFHDAGINCYAWGFHYGNNIDLYTHEPSNLSGEIHQAIAALELADGYIIDAEGQFEGHADWADQLSLILRNKINEIYKTTGIMKYTALTSFGYPIDHNDFPFREFLRNCDKFMPQLYVQNWNKEPVDGLLFAGNAFSILNKSLGGDARPIIPMMGTYNYDFGGGHIFQMTKERVAAFLDYAKGYLGCAVFTYQETENAQWDAMKENAHLYPNSGFMTPNNAIYNKDSNTLIGQTDNNAVLGVIHVTTGTAEQKVIDLQQQLQEVTGDCGIIKHQMLDMQQQMITEKTQNESLHGQLLGLNEILQKKDLQIGEFITQIKVLEQQIADKDKMIKVIQEINNSNPSATLAVEDRSPFGVHVQNPVIDPFKHPTQVTGSETKTLESEGIKLLTEAETLAMNEIRKVNMNNMKEDVKNLRGFLKYIIKQS